MNEPELDKECSNCGGAGYCRGNGPQGTREMCLHCDGFGRVPTEFGKKVLAFVLGRLVVGERVEIQS